jgi:hypothetical protein
MTYDVLSSLILAYKVEHRTSMDKIIALMMEAVHASEMSVYFKETTRHYIPEGCHLKDP